MKLSSSTQTPLKIPIVVKLMGFSSLIYSQCMESTRNKIKVMGATLIITPILSGLLIAYAFSGLVFKQLWVFFPIFLIWTLLIFTLDRLLIANTLNMFRAFTRIFAALVFSILHAFVLDTLCFRNDIELALEEERQSKIDAIRQRANQALRIYSVRIDSLNGVIAAQRDRIIEEQNKLELENNGKGGSGEEGKGPIYKQQEILAAKIETEAREIIALHQGAIDSARQEKVVIKSVATAAILALPTLQNNGLIHYLGKLHELIFVKRKGIVILFFIVWFFVSCFFELLPLLAKSSLNINEYSVLETGTEQTNMNIHAQEIEKMLTLEKEKIVLQFHLDERVLRLGHDLSMLEEKLESIIQELEVKESYLEQMLTKQANIHANKSGEFAYHVQPAFDKAFREFETITG
ncbi:MAG: DUF4407 domain-containing protein [Saprospiraceae bacterium]|nr:DUF4407 domain-containing protein [Saprospiraceae bacterium]